MMAQKYRSSVPKMLQWRDWIAEKKGSLGTWHVFEWGRSTDGEFARDFSGVALGESSIGTIQRLSAEW